jgi:hypothetical protein
MRTSHATVIALVLATASSVAYVYLAFRAGCAGDLKGGSLGDPHEALRIQGLSLAPMLIALLTITAIPFISMQTTPLKRTIASIALFLLGFAALEAGGIYAEFKGVQQCFSELPKA